MALAAQPTRPAIAATVARPGQQAARCLEYGGQCRRGPRRGTRPSRPGSVIRRRPNPGRPDRTSPGPGPLMMARVVRVGRATVVGPRRTRLSPRRRRQPVGLTPGRMAAATPPATGSTVPAVPLPPGLSGQFPASLTAADPTSARPSGEPTGAVGTATLAASVPSGATRTARRPTGPTGPTGARDAARPRRRPRTRTTTGSST